jgi:hypothetical protein
MIALLILKKELKNHLDQFAIFKKQMNLQNYKSILMNFKFHLKTKFTNKGIYSTY